MPKKILKGAWRRNAQIAGVSIIGILCSLGVPDYVRTRMQAKDTSMLEQHVDVLRTRLVELEEELSRLKTKTKPTP